MGHQESFLMSEDFDWLVSKVNKLGAKHFEDRFVSVVEVVTLDRELKFDLGYMCQPDIKYSFPKGTKFLWICGERHFQRLIWGKDGLLGKRQAGDMYTDLFFIECMAEKIFDKHNKPKFTYEGFVFKK